jgi:GxxExxY protein
MLHSNITNKIISAYYRVYNTLGHGFLEKVYENAMMVELKREGLKCAQQEKIKVYYDGIVVGDYFAELVVEGVVLVELKACGELCEEHEAQVINDLKATGKEVGLLLNFGPKPGFKRKIFSRHFRSAVTS